MSDSNRRPTDYKSVALPTELIRQIFSSYSVFHLKGKEKIEKSFVGKFFSSALAMKKKMFYGTHID